MYTFQELIRKIRDEAGLTQPQFARALNVSSALIAMVETGQKEVSKKLIQRLAILMEVNPISITPFLFKDKLETKDKELGNIERKLIEWGQEMQIHLITKKAKKLKKYAEPSLSQDTYSK